MLKYFFPKSFHSLALLLIVFSVFPNNVNAQQRKIPSEPFQIVDSTTGKSIDQILIIPRFSSFQGVSTMLGEGPGNGTYRDYLDKPFIYRPGEPFILKLPKSTGINAIFIFVGKGRSIQDILIVAQKYQPQRVSDLWSTGDKRKLQLIPVSDDNWSALLERELRPIINDVSRINADCRFWDLPEKCSLEIHYDKKERKLIRSFLEQNKIGTK